VLRSALWHWRRDFAWATRVAAGIGRGIAFLMIAAGIVLFIFQGSFSGAWLAFVGWFLLEAASAEVSYMAARQALGDLSVRDLMVRRPVTVAPDTSVGRFMDDTASTHRHTTYPVVDGGGRMLGLLSFPCLASLPRGEWDERRVAECMLPLARVPVLAEDDAALDALGKLTSNGANRGVVLDGDRLVALLSLSDLARALHERSRRAHRAGSEPRLAR
jgi:CBS domain-containing protein